MVRAGHAAQIAWDALGGEARAKLLERAADLYEAHAEEFFSLCTREAGKTLIDAVLEVREAVDFLRFYASEARRQFTKPLPLPGPTGEQNELRLHGRGVIAAISPWNFPLAIFTGLVSAPLAAGNAVIAKPAGQTPLIGALAVELMHQAGIPKDVVQLAPGSGRVVGGALTAHPLLAGVVFTGSTETARMINRTLAERDGPIIPFIAETGGQNAMIVDSSALPEQVTRDVISSAFQSAGQRCSALRVLFIQEDVADGMIKMIAGAMEALHVGNPSDLATDVGPVIDEAAKNVLDEHLEWLDKNAKLICQLKAPKEAANGCFVAPAFYEIDAISNLNRENFGPILHVIRFAGDRLGQVVNAINAHRLWPDARAPEPHRHRPRLCRGACARRQFLRQPQPDRRGGREPAVRRRRPFGHRPQGRRAALCCALRDRAGDVHRHNGGRRQCEPDGDAGRLVAAPLSRPLNA